MYGHFVKKLTKLGACAVLAYAVMACVLVGSLYPTTVLAHPGHEAHEKQLSVSHELSHLMTAQDHEHSLSADLQQGSAVLLLSLGLFLIFARSRKYSGLKLPKLSLSKKPKKTVA